MDKPTMNIKFFVSSGESFTCKVPNGADKACLVLPKEASRFDYWRKVTGDKRLIGHAMVWEVVPHWTDYEYELTTDEESSQRIG
jgi:hypothetical protein